MLVSFFLHRIAKTRTPTMSQAAGFTLIELLVVIAIIAMLSSIVLASVNSTRIKANNNYSEQTLRQYMVAFEQFYLDNNRLPDPSPGSNNSDSNHYCLGSNYCIAPNITPSNTKLNTELGTYFTNGLPNINQRPLASSFGPNNPYTGISYGCNSNIGSVPSCKGANLNFVLEGIGQNCTKVIPSDMLTGIPIAINASGNTYCNVSIMVR